MAKLTKEMEYNELQSSGNASCKRIITAVMVLL